MSKVYEIVTQRITDEMAKGKVPWRQPWSVKFTNPCNYAGRRYKGMNFFLLSMLGFETPIFLTYNQIQKLNGKLREGCEKSHVPVFFWKWLKKEQENAVSGDVEYSTLPIFRYFRVWNIADVEGIELPLWFIKQRGDEGAKREHNPIQACEDIITGYADKPEFTYGHGRNCYIPSTDRCQMVDASNFVGDVEFYVTKFHELVHSTGHGTRLNRKGVTEEIKFGSHAYSEEELVAELGAAMLSAEARIDTTESIANNAAYLNSWIAKLTEQPKMFAIAAARAQKAADYILGRNDEFVETED